MADTKVPGPLHEGNNQQQNSKQSISFDKSSCRVSERLGNNAAVFRSLALGRHAMFRISLAVFVIGFCIAVGGTVISIDSAGAGVCDRNPAACR